jgi:hypothetical protein
MQSEAHRYSRAPRDAKGKTVFSSDSKLMLYIDWNQSKVLLATDSAVRNPRHYGWLSIASTAASIGIAASLAIGSSGVARSARMREGGILVCAPSEMVSGVADIIVDRSGAIGGRSVDDTAFRQPHHHPVTHR